MKAFKLTSNDETEFIAAPTLIFALAFYTEFTGIDLSDFTEGDSIEEVSPEDCAKITIANTEYDEHDPDDKEEYTLAELLAECTQCEILGSTII